MTSLPHEMAVPIVVGMDGHGRIAQHRLRPRRSDHDLPLALGERIPDVPEAPRLRVVLDLQIGDGGPAAGAPVDDVIALVDEAVVEEADENLPDGLRKPLVHREALARPVAGAAEALELVDDHPAVLGLPLPDPFDELLPAEVVPGETLFRQLLFDDVLRRDPGMVHPRQPQGVVALHPACNRTTMSWSTLFRTCPMWSIPVTFGGGMTIENGFFALASAA